MKKKAFDDVLDFVEKEFKNRGISRRDALKIMTSVASSSLLLNGQDLKSEEYTSDATAKIVIVGGGLAGISTAAKLASSIEKPDITIIEPNINSVSYQSGFILASIGLYKQEDILYNTKDFIPSGVKFLKDKAIEFNPEENEIRLKSGDTIAYDFMVLATGIIMDYSSIKGLEDIGEIYSNGSGAKILKKFGNRGITSIYNLYSSLDAWEQLQKFVSEAKKGKKLNAIFTQSNRYIKGAGASKSFMFLTHSELLKEGVRENVNLTFYPNRDNLCSAKVYNDALVNNFDKNNLKLHYRHKLIQIDVDKKIATFDKYWKQKGDYNHDLEKYNIVTKHLNVQMPYDFIHITPPMRPSKEIINSALVDDSSYVPVDKHKLQHLKYKNIFALGDVANLPIDKSGASIRREYKIVCENLISLMNGKDLSSNYKGYTAEPIITDIGKIILAEYNWNDEALPSFPLDPSKDRYFWWLVFVYLIKPLSQYGVLSGKA